MFTTRDATFVNFLLALILIGHVSFCSTIILLGNSLGTVVCRVTGTGSVSGNIQDGSVFGLSSCNSFSFVFFRFNQLFLHPLI